MTIGYEKARNLMRQLKWEAHVTMHGEELIRVELSHPMQPNIYNVRRDAAKKLLPECVVSHSLTNETAVMVYDFDKANK